MNWREMLLKVAGHKCPDTMEHVVENQRSMMRGHRKQIDYRELLLRTVREVSSDLPEWLIRDINCATASESESDIEGDEREVARYIESKGVLK